MAYSIEENFKAVTKPIISLINGNDKFVIPEFQRDYSWKKAQIETFLKDILDSKYTADNPNTPQETYFLGPVITYQETGSNDHLIIDGQQRITTIVLTVAALRDLLVKYENKLSEDYDKMLVYEDKSFAGKFTKTSRLVVSNRDSKKYIEELLDINNQNLEPHVEGASVNLHEAYKLIIRFLTSEEFTELEDVISFVNHMLNNTGITWITATDLDQALLVFERMNYRGDPLSMSDLIKYYLFTGKSLDDLGDDTEKIGEMWTTITKKLIKVEGKNAKLDRFFKYFITSRYMSSGVLQEKNLINWIKNEEKNNPKFNVSQKPILFLKELDKEMDNYISILRRSYPPTIKLRDDEDSKVLPQRRISTFGKELKQHLPLLMAAARRGVTKDEYDKLASAIENLAFVMKLTKSQWNDVEKQLAKWCDSIRNEVPIDEFIENEIIRLIKTKTDEISSALKYMDENKRIFTKYILLRMENHLRDTLKMGVEWYNWGKNGVLELEHILSINHKKTAIPNDKDGKPLESEVIESWKWRLGNMTILTPYANKDAKNDDPAIKLKNEVFKDSSYLLSKSIQTDVMESKQARGGGQQKKLNLFAHKTISLSKNYWTEKQISEREKFYYSIFNDILFNGDKKQFISP
tara:strand:+ start:2381 stop:4285 length:1905 start_codon:yes stop_codon:yes gene_type:complete